MNVRLPEVNICVATYKRPELSRQTPEIPDERSRLAVQMFQRSPDFLRNCSIRLEKDPVVTELYGRRSKYSSAGANVDRFGHLNRIPG